MARNELFALTVAILTLLTASLIRPSCFTRSTRPTHVKTFVFFPSPQEVEDSYDSLLDLESAIDPAEAINASMLNNFYENLRLNALSAQQGASGNSESTLEHQLEKQFGDLHTVPADEEPWMTEVRDIIEKKRGVAIWSKRSDQDIQKEAKKAVASRGMHIPASVATVVNAVHVEKTCTLAEMKAEEGVAYAEYRRWLREQREKLKKDPLPAVKLELVKRWLERHPTARVTTASMKPKRVSGSGLGLLLRSRPTVVLDEVSDILDTRVHPCSPATTETVHEPGFLAVDEEEEVLEGELLRSKPMMTVTDRQKHGVDSSGGSGVGPLPQGVLAAVPSIVNWNKTRRELFAAENRMAESRSGGSDGVDGELEVIRRGLLSRLASLRQGPTSDTSGGGEAVDHGFTDQQATSRGGGQRDVQEHDEYFVVL